MAATMTIEALPERPPVEFAPCSERHRIAFRRYLPPEDVERRVPVICAHGLTRNSFDFHELAEWLARSGHEVVAFDTSGRGDSDPLPEDLEYGYPQYVPDLMALLRHLGWREVHWIGTSMGGMQGMFLACLPAPMRPVHFVSLVLNDIGPFIPEAAMVRIASYVGTAPEMPNVSAAEAYVRATASKMLPATDADWRRTALYLTRPKDPSKPDGERELNYDVRIAEPLRAAPPQAIDLWGFWAGVTADAVLVLRGQESDILLPDTYARMLRPAEHGAVAPPGIGSVVEGIEYVGVGHAPTLFSDAMRGDVSAFLARAEACRTTTEEA